MQAFPLCRTIPAAETPAASAMDGIRMVKHLFRTPASEPWNEPELLSYRRLMVATQQGHLERVREGGACQPVWWRRMWRRLMPGPDATLIQAQLNGQLAVLEGARAELEAGWVQGRWWTAGSNDGTPRVVTGFAAAAGGSPGDGDGACLVGALARAGSRRPDAASEVGRAVDAVYDALWASRGQPGVRLPGGLPPVPPPEVRLARVRTLIQWNDRAERTPADVLAVVDRAISATIMDLMSVPRPAPAAPAGASPTASARRPTAPG